MGNEGYIGYQSMLASVTSGIVQLDSICRHLSMEGHADELKIVGGRLKNHIFSVGIMGEFRRGKSTVINALLGQEIVPADIVPCSATLNYVKWDVNKSAEIYFKDGTKQQIPVEALSRYVTKITKESEEMSAKVEKAIVYYPCQFCQNGVQIIDTPGLNDDERMSSISEKVIPTLDAIIMVIVPDSPFSQSEAEFVRNKVMASDLGRIIFVVNKIDTIDEDDRDRLLQSIREKIQTSVLEKMAAVYGEDSDEYKNTKEKLGDIKLLPISAKKALKGKMKGDAEFIRNSGYAEFEEVLSHLLTEERGILELLHPVNQLFSVSSEALKMIETRISALNMEADEFEKKQIEALEQLKETRSRKKDEIAALKNKGMTLYATLLPDIADIYDEIELSLRDYIESYPVADASLQDQAGINAFSEEISKEIDTKMKDMLSLHTERLIYKIREQLGNDVQELEEFSKELSEGLDQIHFKLSANGGNHNDSAVKNILFDVGGMYATLAVFGANIPGIGGLVAGFKEHGVKGAVAGGLSGVTIGFAAAMLCASVGIFGLPFALIAGTASTFGGKAVTNLLFGSNKSNGVNTEKIRSSLLTAVTDILREFKSAASLENWLKETCESAYSSIADDIDKEWENSLASMENTLTQIKIDIEMNAANKTKLENDMKAYADEISAIAETMKPIKDKLSMSLHS